MNALPLVLLILDGWGIPTVEEAQTSILTHTYTPTLSSLLARSASTHLQAHGTAVGLPEGYIGNSEVGHSTIGSGRIIYQDFVRIEKSIADGSFFSMPVLVEAIQKTKNIGGKLHCMGLLSSSGVHAHLEHFKACILLAKQYNIELFLHLFTDGRDAGIHEGQYFLEELQTFSKQHSTGTIASIIGRYYAMDRDSRLERTQTAYDSLTIEASVLQNPMEYLQKCYAEGESDEFLKPALFAPHSRIEDNDTLFFLNFRADRARQLTQAFLNPTTLPTPKKAKELTALITMTRYGNALNTTVLFEKEPLDNTLGDVLEQHGLSQLRIAETEKYAHVTYFFNGGKETPSAHETHILVPSPADVATYDEKPEMSAELVTEKLVTAIRANSHDVYVCNFANLDMVGHTGIAQATQKAFTTIDYCIYTIYNAIRTMNGTLIIIADHGNAEAVSTEAGVGHTQHTCNPVPCIINLPEEIHGTIAVHSGGLQDIAPTILYLLGIQKPVEMTGTSLISISP